MIQSNIEKLIVTIQKGQKALMSLSAIEKTMLEKEWDIEHAYYSSALEGSKVDRKEFEKFAEQIA